MSVLSTPCRLLISRSNRSAFSLVEVVIALGLATFALMGIIALLPMGFRIAGDSYDESRAVNAMTRIIADRRATPLSEASTYYTLPKMGSSDPEVVDSFGLKEDGTRVAINSADEVYRVSFRTFAPVSGRKDPWRMWLRINWPAKGTNSSSAVETVATFSNHP